MLTPSSPDATNPFAPLAAPYGDEFFRYLAHRVATEPTFSSVSTADFAGALDGLEVVAQPASAVVAAFEAAGYLRRRGSSYLVVREAVALTAQALTEMVPRLPSDAPEVMKAAATALGGGTRSIFERSARQGAPAIPAAQTSPSMSGDTVPQDVEAAANAGLLVRAPSGEPVVAPDLLGNARLLCAVVPAGQWQAFTDSLGDSTLSVWSLMAAQTDQLHVAKRVLQRQAGQRMDIQQERGALGVWERRYAKIPDALIVPARAAYFAAPGAEGEGALAALAEELGKRSLGSGEIADVLRRRFGSIGPTGVERMLEEWKDLGLARSAGSQRWVLTPRGYFAGASLFAIADRTARKMQGQARARVIGAMGSPRALDILRAATQPDLAGAPGGVLVAAVATQLGLARATVHQQLHAFGDARLITGDRGVPYNVGQGRPIVTYQATALTEYVLVYNERFVDPRFRWHAALRLMDSVVSRPDAALPGSLAGDWTVPSTWPAAAHKALALLEETIANAHHELGTARSLAERLLFQGILSSDGLRLLREAVQGDGAMVTDEVVNANLQLITFLDGRVAGGRLTFPRAVLSPGVVSQIALLPEVLPPAASIRAAYSGETQLFRSGGAGQDIFGHMFFLIADVLQGYGDTTGTVTPLPRSGSVSPEVLHVIAMIRRGQTPNRRGRVSKPVAEYRDLLMGLTNRAKEPGDIAKALKLPQQLVDEALGLASEVGLVTYISDGVHRGQYCLAPEALVARRLLGRLPEVVLESMDRNLVRFLIDGPAAEWITRLEELLVTQRMIDDASVARALGTTEEGTAAAMNSLVAWALVVPTSRGVETSPLANRIVQACRACLSTLRQLPSVTRSQPKLDGL